MQQCIKIFISYLYEAQHVSGDTQPIVKSLKLHWQPLVLHAWKIVGRVVAGPWPNNTQHSHETDVLAPGEIRTHNLRRRATADPRLRPRGHRDRQLSCFFLSAQQPPVDHGLLIHEVSRLHTTMHHSQQDSSGRVISSSQRPLPENTQHSQQKNIHAPGGIQTHDLSWRAAAVLRLRPRGHWDRHLSYLGSLIIYLFLNHLISWFLS